MEMIIKEDAKVIIVDPTSTEFNRGSFCYLPYLLYNGLIEAGVDVELTEDFTAVGIDRLDAKGADIVLVALWSYPQVDIALTLHKFLKTKTLFFGYYELCKQFNLPIYKVPNELIRLGMLTYPDRYNEFVYLLLSDCDMHLKEYEGQVYPLFTSYGCPQGCSFCPSTVNCDRTRITLTETEVEGLILHCHKRGFKNIHFTDEDFFHNPYMAKRILLQTTKLGGFNLIAMGGVSSVSRYLELEGAKELLESGGMRLIEVGLETGDEDLMGEMQKGKIQQYEWLAKDCPVPILWLTMTFYPGETITSLSKTGAFLKRHGFKPDELYERIQTNGTEGGLGQFFQFYPGTKIEADGSHPSEMGVFINSSWPVRLMPSFVPYTFLNSAVRLLRPIEEEDKKWFKLYRVPEISLPAAGRATVWDSIEFQRQTDAINEFADLAVAHAICARLGIIGGE